MATQILLAKGEGTGGESYFDLTPYILISEGISESEPDEDGYRFFDIGLHIQESTSLALQETKRTIWQYLLDAPDAYDPLFPTSGINLCAKFKDSTDMVYVPIVSGILLEESALYEKNTVFATLSIKCDEYGYGDAETDTITASLGNGENSTLFRENIKGDVPALCALRFVDDSSAGYINQILIGQASVSASGDYVGFIDVTPTETAYEVTDAGATGGEYASIIPNVAYTEVCYVQRTSAKEYGLTDVWVRARSNAPNLSAPELLSAVSWGAGQTRNYSDSGYVTVATSNPSVSWIGNTLKGSLLILSLAWKVGAFTPTTPAGWTLFTSKVHSTVTGYRIYTYYKANADSESGAVTIITSGNIQNYRMTLMELVGAAISSPTDKAITAEGTTSAIATGTSGVLAQAYEKAYLFCVHNGTAISTAFSGWIAHVQGSQNVVWSRVTNTTTAISGSETSSNTAWVTVMITVKMFQTSQTTVTAGKTFTICVVPVNSSSAEGIASNTLSGVSSPYSQILLIFNPGVGSVNNYRVYYKYDALAWRYISISASLFESTYIIFNTESGAVTKNPDGEESSMIIRGGVTIPSGEAHTQYGHSQPFALHNSTWELIYLGRFALPPIPKGHAAANIDWKFVVELRDGFDSNYAVDVDGILALPARRAKVLSKTFSDIETLREHYIESMPNRTMRSYLRDTSTQDERGFLSVNSFFALQQGDTKLIWHLLGVNRESSLSLSAQLQLVIRPRYRQWAEYA